MPRWTASRDASRPFQRSRCGSPSRSTPRPAVRAHPRPVRDVRDRKVARQVFVVHEPCVQDAEEPTHLALVAVDGQRDLLRQVTEEDVGLAHHRADPAHLEHEPLHDDRASLRVGRHQPPRLLGEVNENRAGLEHGEIVEFAIHDGGDAPVGADLQEFRAPLLEFRKVDDVHPVGKAQFLEGDRDLVAIRSRSGV